jgi:hypothetical protein
MCCARAPIVSQTADASKERRGEQVTLSLEAVTYNAEELLISPGHNGVTTGLLLGSNSFELPFMPFSRIPSFCQRVAVKDLTVFHRFE